MNKSTDSQNNSSGNEQRKYGTDRENNWAENGRGFPTGKSCRPMTIKPMIGKLIKILIGTFSPRNLENNR